MYHPGLNLLWRRLLVNQCATTQQIMVVITKHCARLVAIMENTSIIDGSIILQVGSSFVLNINPPCPGTLAATKTLMHATLHMGQRAEAMTPKSALQNARSPTISMLLFKTAVSVDAIILMAHQREHSQRNQMLIV